MVAADIKVVKLGPRSSAPLPRQRGCDGVVWQKEVLHLRQVPPASWQGPCSSAHLDISQDCYIKWVMHS